MNAILLSLSVLFLSFNINAADKPYIISGFDDVLRQAENTGLVKAALKIFEPDKTFSGMPELYTVVTKEEPNPKFVLVSAISNWFDGRIEKFLKETKYPVHERYLRNWFTEWSIENFKTSRIKEIISKNPGRSFIVIFDNSSASLELAKELHSLYSKQIKAIYLRQVVEKEIPTTATRFYTAFDIAVKEYVANRMTVDEAQQVGHAVLKEVKSEMLFPSYASCPAEYSPCDESTLKGLGAICTQVRDHIRKFCKKDEGITK
jgi:phosphatidate phosphatase APP1